MKKVILLISLLLLSCGKKEIRKTSSLESPKNVVYLLSKEGANDQERIQFLDNIQEKLSLEEKIIIEPLYNKKELPFNEPRSFITSSAIKSNSYKVAYKNGDLYYLLAATDSWGKKEWNYFYSFSKWAVKRHFRTILIPNTTQRHLEEAVQNSDTTVIIWSSHGNKSGYVVDYDNQKIAKGSFSKNKGKRFNKLVLNNCHGEKTIKYYNTPSNTTYWKGLTNSDDMISYLNSDRFDKSVLKSLGKTNFND